MVERCGRAKLEGGACGSPALKGKSFCYYHDPSRQRRTKAVRARYFLELTMLETGGAVQAALSETLQALASNEIGSRLGGRLLYALQLASTGKKQATPPAHQASPRSVKIARAPGFKKIYSTAKHPAASPVP